MKKTLFLLLLSIASYGQADFPEGIKLGGNTATAETSKIVSQQPTTGELNYVNATALPVSIAVQDSLDGKISKNSTPETKIGGLTIGGVNNAYASDNWIALGTSVTNRGTYSIPMAAQLNLILTNLGVEGGDTSTLPSLYASIPTLNSDNENNYRLISIEYGLNDALTSRAISVATYRANIEALIANIKSKGWTNKKILIINGNYTTDVLRPNMALYAAEAILIAKEQGIQYSDTYNYTLANGAGTLLSDGVHPTAAGGLVYKRGVIASMQGGGEFSNALTVANGLVANGVKSYENIELDFTKSLLFKGIYTNYITPSSVGGHTIITNGSSTGVIDFNVSNGVTNALAHAVRINNNKLVEFYGGSTTSGVAKYLGYSEYNLNSFIQCASIYNRIWPGVTSGNMVFDILSSTGGYDFNINSGGIELVNVFKINNNKTLTIASAPTTSAGSYDILTRNSSTGVVEKISNIVTQTITNGVTTSSPSEDAVYDALDLKRNLSDNNFSGGITSGGTITLGTTGTGLSAPNNGNISFTCNHPSSPGWTSNAPMSATLFKSSGYTVATLPLPPVTGAGTMAYVTDATAPTYLGTLTGGGAVVCPVFYNGTAWVAH